MNCFKHIATVFLLACISIPLLMPAVWQLKQTYVQWEMLEKMEKEELVQIKIKTADVNWVKYKKECIINGDMFDVKQLKVTGDELLLTGLFDEKEKEIKKQLEDFTKNQQQADAMQQFVKLFSVLFYNTSYIKTPAPAYVIMNQPESFVPSIYTSPYLGYTTPPPKFS
ncbi:MAG: hypothetical protein K2Q24_04455 [Chitinophagaceae bacterium]|jgi:hypothetical protein|nr:hypothetical protein [Chitinophagaceae bacterium]